jgi:hypothetical protein
MASKPKTKGEQKPAIDAAEKVAPATENTGAKQLDPFKWAKGQSGNPKGRPKGARNKLTEDFFADMLSAWETHGAAAFTVMASEEPSKFVQCVASLMPKQLEVSDERNMGELSDSEIIEALDAIRSLTVANLTNAAGAGASVPSGKTKPH